MVGHPQHRSTYLSRLSQKVGPPQFRQIALIYMLVLIAFGLSELSGIIHI
jgi:hypothetical protein